MKLLKRILRKQRHQIAKLMRYLIFGRVEMSAWVYLEQAAPPCSVPGYATLSSNQDRMRISIRVLIIIVTRTLNTVFLTSMTILRQVPSDVASRGWGRRFHGMHHRFCLEIPGMVTWHWIGG